MSADLYPVLLQVCQEGQHVGHDRVSSDASPAVIQTWQRDKADVRHLLRRGWPIPVRIFKLTGIHVLKDLEAGSAFPMSNLKQRIGPIC